MNIQKFLGKSPSIRNPAAPYRSGTALLATKLYSGRVGRRVKETPIIKNLLSIHKKVISIENILKNITNLDRKTVEFQGKVKATKEQENRNKKRKSSGIGSQILGTALTPAMGALDMIKNFVTFTFLGWLFNLIQPHIDKLQFIFPLIQGAFDFLVGALKLLLGGIGNFIKFGYDVKDTITGAVDKIKSQAANLKKDFDDTLTALSDVVNNTIKVATSFLENTEEDPSKTEDVASTIPPLPSLPNTDIASVAVPTSPVFPVQTLASGGRIDPNSPVTRGVQPQVQSKQTLIKPIPQEQKTDPGKDVGGVKKIKELYKSETQDNSFFGMLFGGSQKRDGLVALTKTSRELKKPSTQDFLGLGNIMGAAVDVSLGQKPERKTYQQFADGIRYLVNFGMMDPEGFGKMNLERMIETMVQSKVDLAINRIREEINKQSGTTPPSTTPTIPGGGATPGSSPLYGGPGIEGLADFIAKAETGGRWNAYNGDWRTGSKGDDTILGLKLSELRSYMDRNYPNSSGAVGAYQFMPETAIAYAKQLGLDPNKTVFSAEIQRKLNIQHLRDLGYDDYVSGKISRNEYGRRIAQQYRAVPDPYTGKTYGDSASSRNRATVTLDSFNSALDSSKQKATNLQIIKGGPIKGGAVVTQRNDPDAEQTGSDISIGRGRVGDKIQNPFQSLKIKKVGFQGSGSGVTGRGYGKYIVGETIINGKRYEVVLAHLNKALVKEGDILEAGDVIGEQGISGRATGPHVSTHVNALNGGNPNSVLSSIENVWVNGGTIETKSMGEPTSKKQKPPVKVSPQPKPQATKPQSPQQKPSWLDNLNPSNWFKPKSNSQQKKTVDIGSKNLTPFLGSDGKFYYADIQGNAIYNESGVPVEVSRTKNTWLIKDLSNKIQSTKKLQKGGLIYSKNTPSLMPPEQYASYNDPGLASKIYIQPVIIQNVVPIQSNNQSSIMFPSPKVNSSKSQSLVRS